MVTNALPKTLQEAVVYFSDPANCLKEIVRLRWPDGIVKCPTCGSSRVSFLTTRRLWKCSEDHPKRQFSAKVGSIMEDSAIGLDKWLIAMWLIPNAKNGISSYELARAIGIRQKAAWFVLHRIRLAMQDDAPVTMRGEIEIDESFIGGKARFMHKSKRRRLGITRVRSHVGKVAVMGLLERHGKNGSQVRLARIDGVKKHHLMPHIQKHIVPGSTVHTDALPSYQILDSEYIHNVIDHAEQYVNGNVHTNGLENFWSLLKRTLKGTYVSVEPFHLFRYLDEQAFRFNNRKLSDASRFALTAASIFGKRLTFAQLTASNASL